MAIFVCLLFAALALIIMVARRGGEAAKKSNQLPSPSKLPIIGNLHQLGGSLFHRSLRALSDKHGPLMLLHLGNIPTLVVSSAEMAEEILKTHDLAFAGRRQPTSSAARQIIYGCIDVAFAPYGEYWRQARKICVTSLLSPKRVQSFVFVREEEVANMIKEISGSCSIAAINLSETLLALTSNILSRVALGKKYPALKDMAKEMEVVLGTLSVRTFFPWLGWIDVVNGLESRMKRFCRVMDIFLDQVIDDHLIRQTDYAGNDEEGSDFVDILLHIQKDATNAHVHLTKDNIKALIVDMFIAGIGSTSVSLEWVMAELMKNPDKMKKAQAEVRKVVGSKAKVEDVDLVKMDYLRWVIKETLRLHPPGPLLLPHESTTSTTVRGYHISQETLVLINVWAIGRDPKSWENADVFLPERFANNPIDFKGQDFELLPFGAGRRICPGISFAMGTIELVLANLLCWFDWELPGGTNKKDVDMSEVSGIVVHRKFPLHLFPTYRY